MKLRCLVTALCGLWFMLAPWMVGFPDHALAASVSVVAGAVQLVSSLWAFTKSSGDSLPNLITLITGLLFAIMPFTFMHVRDGIALTLIGMLSIGLSFWNLSSK